MTLTNDGPTCDAINASGQACRGTPIDWRARALAAEAALADAGASGRAHGAAAVALMLDDVADDCLVDALAAVTDERTEEANKLIYAMEFALRLRGVTKALAAEASRDE